MKRIICDMDGVLVDLLPAWLSLFGERTGCYIRPEDITAYGLEAFIPEELRSDFFGCLPMALEIAPPMRGTHMLEHCGDNIKLVLVSYVHPVAPNGHKTKMQWLKNWFPGLEAPLNYMNGERAFLQADYMIDDNPAHIEAWLANNPEGHAFLVQHSYNQRGDLSERCTVVESFDDAWGQL